MKYLRTNNGLEFCSDEFNTLCKKEGVKPEKILIL